jgi:hypothetical protein
MIRAIRLPNEAFILLCSRGLSTPKSISNFLFHCHKWVKGDLKTPSPYISQGMRQHKGAHLNEGANF